MSKSSLSSVVSNLVRASMGSSVSNDVTDEDLDRHIAELILKEAKQKGERYNTDGIQAYLKSGLSDSNAPKTNKRFLSSIIRNTDDHNRTILRAQAFAAQEIKRARDEQERKERKARAEEAVAAERTRRLLGTARRTDSDRWSRKKDMIRNRRGKERARESVDEVANEDYIRRKHEPDSRQRRHRHRSCSDEKDGDWEERRSLKRAHNSSSASTSTVHKQGRPRSTSGITDNDDVDDDSDQHRYGRHNSRDRYSSSHKRRRYRSRSTSLGQHSRSHSTERTDNARIRSETLPDSDVDILGNKLKMKSQRCRSSSPVDKSRIRVVASSHKSRVYHKDKGIYNLRSHSRSPGSQPKYRTSQSFAQSSTHASHLLDDMSRSPSPLPSPPPSKMDKYFEESYDPRLDVAPLSLAPKVPATGLIDNSEFEGWDAMLELIRIRRVDKAEQKTLERLGLGKSKKDKDKKDKDKKWKGLEAETFKDRWREDSQSIMEIEYKKRGSVREWDLGKAEL